MRPREDDRSCERSAARRPETAPCCPQIGAANAGRGESGEASNRDSTGAGAQVAASELVAAKAMIGRMASTGRSTFPIAATGITRRGLKCGPAGATLQPVTRRQRAVGSGAALRSGPCFLRGTQVRTRVYVDGFNLYYGAVRGTSFKWLDPVRLSRLLLPPHCVIDKLLYFTARVSGIPDPAAPARQQAYLSALGTLPEVEVHYGSFLAKTVWRPLVNLPVAGNRIDAPRPVTLPAGTPAGGW